MRLAIPHPQKEHGATLVTALIMLLMLTVLAIAGSGAAILETRLANNLKFQQQAQEMAEFSLRSAEAQLQQTVVRSDQIFQFFVSDSADHIPGYAAPILKGGASKLPFTPTDVDDRTGWVSGNSVQVQSTNTNLAGRYVVEYIGRVGLPPLDSEDVDRRHFAFRITAIGYSLEGNAVGKASYILQSTYTQPLAGTGALL